MADTPSLTPTNSATPSVMTTSSDTTSVMTTSSDTTSVMTTSSDTTSVMTTSSDTTSVMTTSSDTTSVMPTISDTTSVMTTSSATPFVMTTSSDTPSVMPTSSDTPSVMPTSSDTSSSPDDELLTPTSCAKSSVTTAGSATPCKTDSIMSDSDATNNNSELENDENIENRHIGVDMPVTLNSVLLPVPSVNPPSLSAAVLSTSTNSELQPATASNDDTSPSPDDVFLSETRGDTQPKTETSGGTQSQTMNNGNTQSQNETNGDTQPQTLNNEGTQCQTDTRGTTQSLIETSDNTHSQTETSGNNQLITGTLGDMQLLTANFSDSQTENSGNTQSNTETNGDRQFQTENSGDTQSETETSADTQFVTETSDNTQSQTNTSENNQFIAETNADMQLLSINYSDAQFLNETCCVKQFLTKTSGETQSETATIGDTQSHTTTSRDTQLLNMAHGDTYLLTNTCDDAQFLTDTRSETQYLTETCGDMQYLTERCGDTQYLTERCGDTQSLTETSCNTSSSSHAVLSSAAGASSVLFCDKSTSTEGLPVLQPVHELSMVNDGLEHVGGHVYYYNNFRARLGHGLNSIVYKGKFGPTKSRKIAVKIIKFRNDGEAQETLTELRKIYRETQMLESLTKHPNIVEFIDSYIDKYMLYIAFERAIGSLADYVNDSNESKQMRKMLTLAEVNRGVASGLEYIHSKGIVHRDLKPANIFIKKDYSGMLASVIGDFGCAKTTNQSMYSQSGRTGTSGFIAQEIWRAFCQFPNQPIGEKYTPKSDIFSEGIVFHYTLSLGCNPFGFEHTAQFEIQSGKSPNFDKIARSRNTIANQSLLERMLQHDPTQRPKADDVSSHPAMWTDERILLYLADKSDQIVNKKLDGQSFQLLESIYNIIPNGNWMDILPSNTQTYLKNYRIRHHKNTLYSKQETSVSGLLRAIRNTNSHGPVEYPPNVQAELGDYPGGYVDFWLTACPKLLMHVYEVLGP